MSAGCSRSTPSPRSRASLVRMVILDVRPLRATTARAASATAGSRSQETTLPAPTRRGGSSRIERCPGADLKHGATAARCVVCQRHGVGGVSRLIQDVGEVGRVDSTAADPVGQRARLRVVRRQGDGLPARRLGAVNCACQAEAAVSNLGSGRPASSGRRARAGDQRGRRPAAPRPAPAGIAFSSSGRGAACPSAQRVARRGTGRGVSVDPDFDRRRRWRSGPGQAGGRTGARPGGGWRSNVEDGDHRPRRSPPAPRPGPPQQRAETASTLSPPCNFDIEQAPGWRSAMCVRRSA